MPVTIATVITVWINIPKPMNKCSTPWSTTMIKECLIMMKSQTQLPYLEIIIHNWKCMVITYIILITYLEDQMTWKMQIILCHYIIITYQKLMPMDLPNIQKLSTHTPSQPGLDCLNRIVVFIKAELLCQVLHMTMQS